MDILAVVPDPTLSYELPQPRRHRVARWLRRHRVAVIVLSVIVGVTAFALVRGVTLVHFTDDDYSTFTATRQHELYVGATRVFHWTSAGTFKYADQIAPEPRSSKIALLLERDRLHHHLGGHSALDPDDIQSGLIRRAWPQYICATDVIEQAIKKMPAASREDRRDVVVAIYAALSRQAFPPITWNSSCIDRSVYDSFVAVNAAVDAAVLQYQSNHRTLNADGQSKDYDLPAGKH